MFALATKKNEWDGGVSLWRDNNGTIAHLQTIDCYWCSHMELGTLTGRLLLSIHTFWDISKTNFDFLDPLTQENRVFLVTMSYRMDHTYIREFNKDAGEFQVSFNIDLKLEKSISRFKLLSCKQVLNPDQKLTLKNGFTSYIFSFLKY